jgi:hypothetical protein
MLSWQYIIKITTTCYYKYVSPRVAFPRIHCSFIACIVYIMVVKVAFPWTHFSFYYHDSTVRWESKQCTFIMTNKTLKTLLNHARDNQTVYVYCDNDQIKPCILNYYFMFSLFNILICSKNICVSGFYLICIM